MDNMIVINDLCFKYDDNIIFNNFSLSIEKGRFTTILGNNGSGKSTLVKILCGLLDFSGSVIINGLELNKKNIKSIRRNIGVVFENPDNCLISETVLEDLAFPLENLNLSRDYIYSKVVEVSNYLGISHLLNKCSRDLSGGEKQLVSLGCALVTGPKVLILDEALSMLDLKSKKRILSILKRIKKDFGVTIINVTHDIEESVYGDDILLIDNGNIILHDSKKNVYKCEKELRKYGFDLPFMVDLSNRLSYYDLVDGFVFDMNKMVDLLWK